MKTILDLHIHSKFSRACSKQLTPDNIAAWAQIKGIDIVGTGDFTHPGWMACLKDRLVPYGNGLYRLKDDMAVTDPQLIDFRLSEKKTLFLVTTEVSCIYSQAGHVRRVHLLIFAPSLETADAINRALEKRGCKLSSDGRPILGLNAKGLVKIVFEIDPHCMVVPAHAWTPWFAVFGSKSGFDSLEACFEEYTSSIFAIETGLSSDPAMNFRLSSLDSITLLSNSDAHSGSNLGREANVVDLDEKSYDEIYRVIREKDRTRFLSTIEFYPEEGKYHFDGHRSCGVSFSPEQTRQHHGICPVCKLELTRGVLYRVSELADRPDGFRPQHAIPFQNIVPLEEILRQVFGVTVKNSKRVMGEYRNLIAQAGNEFAVLLELSAEKLSTMTHQSVVEVILANREGRLDIQPGFDGEYGKIRLKIEDALALAQNQPQLF